MFRKNKATLDGFFFVVYYVYYTNYRMFSIQLDDIKVGNKVKLLYYDLDRKEIQDIYKIKCQKIFFQWKIA